MNERNIDPEVKKNLNKEGWEENAAVLFGEKETGELNQLYEQLESEGKATDLGGYIKMHKEIALPKGELSDKEAQDYKGLVWIFDVKTDLMNKDHNEIAQILCRYVDKDGAIAEVDINTDKVSSVEKGLGIKGANHMNMVIKELKELGFRLPVDEGAILGDFNYKILEHRKKSNRNKKKKQSRNLISNLYLSTCQVNKFVFYQIVF